MPARPYADGGPMPTASDDTLRIDEISTENLPFGALEFYCDRVRFLARGPVKEKRARKPAEKAGNPALAPALASEGEVVIFDAPVAQAGIKFPWSKRNVEVRFTVDGQKWVFDWSISAPPL